MKKLKDMARKALHPGAAVVAVLAVASAAVVLEKCDTEFMNYGELSYEYYYPKDYFNEESMKDGNYWMLLILRLEDGYRSEYGVTIDSMKEGFKIAGGKINCVVKDEMPTCKELATELIPELLDAKLIVLTRDSANGDITGYFEGDRCGGQIAVRDFSDGGYKEYEAYVDISNMSRQQDWEELDDAWKSYDSSLYYDSYKV